MKNNFKLLLIVAASFVACSKTDTAPAGVEEPIVITSGTADFSKYVALGNSLTAGYADGALYKAGQQNSWTKILSDQFKLAGGGEFKIPYTNDNFGGVLAGGNIILDNRLYFDLEAKGLKRLSTVDYRPTTEIGVPLVGPFNNMGVPGAKSFHLFAPGYGNIQYLLAGKSNPYFIRFASAPNATIVADAAAQAPTFFTLWIGNNDVLSYATSGGTGNPLTGADPSLYGGNDITNPAVFANVYENIIKTMGAAGAKGGAVANIPNITTIPFFTTIKFNQLTQANLTVDGVNQIANLNTQLYGPLSQVLTAIGQPDRVKPLSATGNNPLLIRDVSLVNKAQEITAVLIQLGYPTPTAGAFGAIFGQARQTTAEDYVLLTTSTAIGAAPTVAEVGFTPPAGLDKYGITFPLLDKHVLSKTEVMNIENAATQYNASIKTLADTYNLAFVDARATMENLYVSGFSYENLILKSDLVFGGAFSLDGVHPTSRGNALIANEFSKAINAKYGSNLPAVKLSNYPILMPKEIK